MEAINSGHHSSNLTAVAGADGIPLEGMYNVSLWEWANQLLQNRTQGRGPDGFAAALRAMKVYYTPSIVVFGLLGNTTIWCTLLWTKLRHLSCTHYLASVMVVNTLYMVALLVQWLKMFGVDLYNTPGLCQFVSFTNSLCVFLSVWFVVGFAVDRYIVSAHASSSPTLTTTLRAKVVIVSLLLVGFVVYVNISLTVGVINIRGKLRCSPLPSFLSNLRVLTIIDMVFNVLLPYSAVICVDVRLMKLRGDASRPADARDDESDAIQNDPDEAAALRNSARRDTGWRIGLAELRQPYADRMQRPMREFAIVFLSHFLVTHLPSEIIRLVHTARGMLDPLYATARWEYYCQILAQHLYNTSLATHIVVFTLFHAPFRRRLLRLTQSSRRRWRACLRKDKAELQLTALSALRDGLSNNNRSSCTMSTSVSRV